MTSRFLPARPLREHDIVLMQIRVPLDELDAGEVLPVAHGLLEERLVGATKVAVDLVGDDAVLPDALLAVCGGADGAMTTPLKKIIIARYLSHKKVRSNSLI